ncbi:MAG: tRNA (N6-threonylcarbamoyladenosine(37)-N6)-methyltransferase TrmO [Desulfobacterales bacterium]|jgi:tRNA-Thr(GGU) m(6)t(6)A37 methyltransferase TsaA
MEKKISEEGIHYTPIGVIRSPFTKIDDMPIQPAGARGVEGTVELRPEYAEGLKDLDGFSHIYLLYHFHQSRGFSLTVTPFLDKTPRGLFATRAPKRPNAIGLSVVRLDRIEGNVLYILDVDILDGTPLLDIKPYVRQFDAADNPSSGWIGKSAMTPDSIRSDDRFR